MLESAAAGVSPRCNLLPERRFVELKEVLAERLAQVASSIQPETFGSLLDSLMRQVFQQGLDEAQAQEGTIWLVESAGEYLVPAYNTGPNASRMVGKFRQPLSAGLICMVFATEQPFVENAVYENAQQSKLLDNFLHAETCSLIAVPFYFLKSCRGVISCVQLRPPDAQEPDPPGFGPHDLAAIQCASSVLTRLIEYRLLSSTIDWAAE